MIGKPLNRGLTGFDSARPLPPSAMPPGGAPTSSTHDGMNTIQGNGQISRNAGEVLIVGHDLGTTACEGIELQHAQSH